MRFVNTDKRFTTHDTHCTHTCRATAHTAPFWLPRLPFGISVLLVCRLLPPYVAFRRGILLHCTSLDLQACVGRGTAGRRDAPTPSRSLWCDAHIAEHRIFTACRKTAHFRAPATTALRYIHTALNRRVLTYHYASPAAAPYLTARLRRHACVAVPHPFIPATAANAPPPAGWPTPPYFTDGCTRCSTAHSAALDFLYTSHHATCRTSPADFSWSSTTT